jgi:hypothetical protein
MNFQKYRYSKDNHHQIQSLGQRMNRASGRIASSKFDQNPQ